VVTALLPALALALPLAALRAQDPGPPVFVEVGGVPAEVWLQQPFVATVRIGCDREWLQHGAVPLFQQPLDLPFHVVVPWLFAAEDRAVELLPGAANGGRSAAVGDRVVALAPAGERQVGGRTFDVLELRCRWLPLAPGTSGVAPVQVRYAFATRFRDDFLRSREPLDRQEATVQSRAAELRVRALPPEAPPGFHGAVGAFAVRASASVAAARVGDTFTLSLDVTGDGNLDRFAPLPPPALPGFHVQGVAERRAPDRRRFELDVLALRAGVQQVPPVPFVAFAPGEGRYVTLRSEPVPLRVDAPPPGTVLAPRVQQLVDADERQVAAANAPSRWWAVAAGLAAVLVGTGLRLRQRRTRAIAAFVRARAELAAAAGADAARQLTAFEALLAARAGVPAWSAAGWERLAAAGVARTAITRARDVHAALDTARFGGIGPTALELQAVADALLPAP
jgi:hypothetical protein